MNLRQLLTASALYGLADVLVLAVGGFLLLPLYTRTLSQADFGNFVIVKTNTEIIGYLIALGLPSAVARLYYDHRDGGGAGLYMGSILLFFLLVATASLLVFGVFGDVLWHLLSPTTPVFPLMWFSLGIAVTTFVAGLGTLWLRLDNRVTAFVAVQILGAFSLTLAVVLLLVVFKLGLFGLLVALLFGYLPGCIVLIYQFNGRFKAAIRREDIMSSLHYGLPFAVGYVGYFILNRFSLLTLQHHLPIEQIAIFGLAQQLAVMISIVSVSFGKALQPAVFGADADTAPVILRRSSRLFILLIFATASVIIMFSNEIILVVATRAYLSGFNVLLVLLIANFLYSLGLVSNTTLQLYRRPRTSAIISVLGAVMSVVLGLALIPTFGLMGGAVATLGAYLATTLLGHIVAWRLSGQSYFGEMAVVTAILCGIALVAVWPGWNEINVVVALMTKLAITATVFTGLTGVYAPQLLTLGLEWIRGKLSETLQPPRY